MPQVVEEDLEPEGVGCTVNDCLLKLQDGGVGLELAGSSWKNFGVEVEQLGGIVRLRCRLVRRRSPGISTLPVTVVMRDEDAMTLASRLSSAYNLFAPG